MQDLNVQVAYRPIPTYGVPDLAPSDDPTSDYWQFWEEQVVRCIVGYKPDGLKWIPGRLYFYLNFCKIKIDDETGQRKKIDSPFYRELDYDLAMTLEEAKYAKKGIIEPKAREVGATVSLVCMTILHEAVFFEASEVAIGTGSEDEIKASKEVLSLAYNELPDELRSELIEENKEVWKFGFISHDITGTGQKTIDKEIGIRTKIHFRDSLNRKPNQLNSLRLAWSFIDECGLINGLRNIHILNRASFESNLVQFGCPVYAGTAKSFASKDNDYEYMYEHIKEFNLIQFFVPKRRAMMHHMDLKTGKVNEVAAQAEIQAMYDIYKDNQIDLVKVQQEYPSEPEHCWMRKSGGLLPLQIINDQIKFLSTHKHFNPRTKELSDIEFGDFKWEGGRFGGEVEWVANEKGKIMIYRHPIEGIKNLYCGGVDSYTKQESVETDSKGSCVIHMRFYGLDESEMPVCVYVDRPQGTAYEAGKRLVGKQIFYNNILKIAKYYNCKLLVEDTDEELFSWFRDNNVIHLALAKKPTDAITGGSNQKNKYGQVRTDGVISMQTDLLNRNLESRPDGIKFKCLLEDLRGWGAKNTDISDAWAYALLYDDDMNLKRYVPRKEEKDPIEYENVGGAEWIRDSSGRLVEISNRGFFSGRKKML